MIAAPDGFGHQAGVDAHRAGQFAEAASRTGVDAEIQERLLERFELLHSMYFFEPRDLTRTDDALTRRHGKPARRTHRLAEATLDAAVDQRIGRRHRLEILQVDCWIFVENDTGIEQALRVE